MVRYPNELDTDADIPRVDDNITEIGGEVINDLREAVFALEETLGLNPHGSATDVAERLDQSLDANGNIKASALSTAGIITTPITDSDVDTNAGIEESKLDLDYGTVQLKTWIDALSALVVSLQAAVAQDIANLTAHTAHPATYGRHMASDVDAYGGTYDGYNLQDTIDDLDGRIVGHITDPVDAHDASAISVDSTPLTAIVTSDVQDAIEQLEDLQLRDVIRHQDRQHSNGVIRAQDTFYGGAFRYGTPIIPASASSSGVVGDEFVRFALAPDSQAFNSIKRGDLVFITWAGTTYSFRVKSTVAPLTINIVGVVPVSGAGTMSVYQSEEETEAPSSLVLALRNSDLSNRASTVQIVHPDAAFILGNGFRGSALSTTNRYLRVQYYGGESGDTGDLDLHTEMAAFSSEPSTWTVENVARILNETLFSPESGGIAPGETHHPLIAFSYLGELGIAYDSPGSDGYLMIGTASSDSAAETLGFTEGSDAYGLSPRSSYIDGYQLSGMAKLVDAYGIITGSDEITVPNASLLSLGVKDGMIARVSGLEDGSYVIKTVGANTLLFDTFYEHNFSLNINKGVHVVIYADAFSLPAAPSDRTLYEMFVRYVDDYGGTGMLEAAPRAEYADFGGFSAINLDITAVSRDFRAASRRVFWDVSRSTLEMGLPVASSVVFTGPRVTVPTDPRGTNVRLYDGYGTDYVEFQIAQTLPLVDGYMDIEIKDPISEERYIQVATVLHDKVSFKFMDDRRLFGTVGRNDVRDDFTRDYTSYPRSILRGNGIIRGMEASGTGTDQVEVEGGEVLVDGKVKSVRSASMPIPADGAATYNLVIDSDGVVRLWRDDYFASGILATPSLVEIMTGDTETILAQVTTNGSNVITAIDDLRRFVGKIDDRIDLIVEENEITHGSFTSFEAAINYLAALEDDAPVPRKFKVRGQVDLATEVELPDHCIVEGDGYAVITGARINYTTSSARLAAHRGVVFRDLAFRRLGTLPNGFIGGKSASGSTLDNVRMEGCGFIFLSQATNNNAIVCDRMLETRISQCRFARVGRGVFVDGFLYGSAINRNVFDGVNQNAIYVSNSDGYGATDLTIAENIISTASFDTGSQTALVRLESPQRTVFRHNSLSCDATALSSPSARMMLWVENTSRYCHFVENTLMNNNGNKNGFQKAVVFDGGGGTASDHFFDTVRGNVFNGFTGGSAQVLDMTNCDHTNMHGNFVWECRAPLECTDCSWMDISNNVFNTLFDSPNSATLVDIHGADTKYMKVVNNNIGSSEPFMDGYMVVLDTSTADSGNIFEGNVVSWGFLAGVNSHAMLLVDGPDWRIMNNDFRTYIVIGFGGFTSDPPIRLSPNAYRTYFAFNNLMHLVLYGAPSKMNKSTFPTRVFEKYNRGSYYEVALPVDRFIADSGTSWVFSFNTGGLGEYKTIFQNAVGSNQLAQISFSTADVPPGAVLQWVYLRVRVGSDVNDLVAWWSKAPWHSDGGTGTLIWVPTPPTTPSAWQNIALPGFFPFTYWMEDDEVHYIKVMAVGALSATVEIAGVSVVYEF